MVEELPAVIAIGGPVRRSSVPELMESIQKQGLGWGYGDYVSDLIFATDADSLLAEMQRLGFTRIYVGNCYFNYGRFPLVEACCQKLEIGYDLCADPKSSEYGGFCARWRPGMGKLADGVEPDFTSFDGGDEMVRVTDVAVILKHLNQKSWRKARTMLRKLLYPVTPLKPLTIVED